VKQLSIKVNQGEHTVTVDPDTPLLFVLNDDLPFTPERVKRAI